MKRGPFEQTELFEVKIMPKFKVVSEYTPSGDQPEAIEAKSLIDNISSPAAFTALRRSDGTISIIHHAADFYQSFFLARRLPLCFAFPHIGIQLRYLV